MIFNLSLIDGFGKNICESVLKAVHLECFFFINF